MPEPFDFFDHAGVINGSAQLGYLSGLTVGKIIDGRANQNPEASPSVVSTRTKMALAGLSVGIVLNGLVETKLGIRLMNIETTPDPIDFVYGVSAASAASQLPRVDLRPRSE